jgi:hypothetical protein
MASTDRTRHLVELQGYCGLSDRWIAEVDPWLRVAPAFCAGWALVATLRGDAGALWVLAAIAALGAMLPWHPFDMPYNAVIRHWTHTAPIPRSRLPRRFACGIACAWLAGTAVAVDAGAPGAALALGVSFTLVALVPVTTGLCVPSWALRRVLTRAVRGSRFEVGCGLPVGEQPGGVHTGTPAQRSQPTTARNAPSTTSTSRMNCD